MTSPLTVAVHRHLVDLLGEPPTPERLAAALRHLAKWRSQVLENTLVARSGDAVLSGPFAGMRFPVRAAEGSRSARLVGGYEASLHGIIEGIVAGGYDLVVDVGCAEGYYATGLALRMPGARVMARDTSAPARALCAEMAAANGVAGRVEIGGEMGHGDFAVCAGARAVVICDIEGAEEELLDPVAAPGLLAADILVEVHEGMRPGLVERLAARFAPSHQVTRIGRRLDDSGLPDWAEGLGDLDRMLLLWEWRSSPTPWLWMVRRAAA